MPIVTQNAGMVRRKITNATITSARPVTPLPTISVNSSRMNFHASKKTPSSTPSGNVGRLASR